MPDRPGIRYLYVPGQSIEKGVAIVAYEPLGEEGCARLRTLSKPNPKYATAK